MTKLMVTDHSRKHKVRGPSPSATILSLSKLSGVPSSYLECFHQSSQGKQQSQKNDGLGAEENNGTYQNGKAEITQSEIYSRCRQAEQYLGIMSVTGCEMCSPDGIPPYKGRRKALPMPSGGELESNQSQGFIRRGERHPKPTQ